MLEKYVAVVTGADSGIGKAVAESLKQDGITTITISEKEGNNNSDLNITLDIRNKSAIDKAVVKIMQEFAQIDLLVNVAGIAYSGGIDTCTEEQWDETLATNVKGYFLMTKAVFKHMKEAGKGQIINMSSIWGVRGNAAMLAYASSKFAVEGLTKCLQEEAKQYGIKVSSLILDKVDTQFRKNMPEYDHLLARKEQMLSVDDIVSAVKWIMTSSPRSLPSSITLDAFAWK
jgi:NAD(P)-dependent dehydrogenase (short-subunit alcohol dehydrogenase family)